MKTLRLVSILIILTFHSFGQCRLTTKSGSYDATCFERLTKESTGSNSGPEIAIAKNGKSGFLILKKPNTLNTQKFRGKVFIYLDDSSIITLLDRGVQWKVNDELFGQYNLTASEVNRLKEINISAVRFWVCFEGAECDSASEYFNNEFTDKLYNKQVIRIDFPKLISELFLEK